MIQIFEGNLKTGFRHVSRGEETTNPHIYYLHVSPLHVKFVMITGASAKGRLTWGNEKDGGRAPTGA